MEEKYTKVIAVGDEAINYLEDIKQIYKTMRALKI